MKKIIMLIALIGVSAAAFSAGKDLGGPSDDRREENRDDGKNQGKGKDLGGSGRAKAKDIAPPRPHRPPHQPSRPHPQPVIVHPHRPRPQPRTVIVTRPAPTPVIVHHSSVVTTTTPAAVAVAETQPAAVRMPESEPIREYWHESAYLGLELHLGNGRYNQNGHGNNGWLDENYSPFGGGFAFSAGYKIPYFRFGGEIGFSSFRTDVTPPHGYMKEEDSFSAFTIMPNIFLDIDIPGSRVAPYVGFAGGIGVLTATYDLFLHFGSSPNRSISATGFDFVYAALAGIRIALTPRTELGVGYRFQDYGVVKVDKYENKIRGHSFNLGLTFRL
jgi:opacity protein-like surface antigen